MSHPPRPYPFTEVSRGLVVRDGKLQVFDPSYKELFETEVALSAEELGQGPPSGEGDFARSLFDLSAVVAHVLGVYQDFYGGEAFLGTAQTQQSLVRHGRRLGYTSDPGVAATGVIAIQIKSGLSGELPTHLPLLSVPKGEQGAENYETLETRHVDAAWNAVELTDATTERVSVPAGATELEVKGVGFDLVPGDLLLLVRDDQPPTSDPPLLVLEEAVEDPVRNTTIVRFTPALEEAIGGSPALSTYKLLAHPQLDLRLFGWDADPRIFPPEELRSRGPFFSSPTTTSGGVTVTAGSTTITTYAPNFGYEVFGELTGSADPPVGHDPRDLYLTQSLADSIVGQFIVREQGDERKVFTLTQQSAVSVSFVREQRQTTSTTIPGQATPLRTDTLSPQWISASTTRIQARGGSTPGLTFRAEHDIRSHWFTGFELELELETRVPNEDTEIGELKLTGDLTGLEPGMLVVLSTRDGSAAQLVELTAVTVTPVDANIDGIPDDANADGIADAVTTTIAWTARGPGPAGHVFQKSDLFLLGNVVRASHGKSVNEILGDSDGVTPFQLFELKKSPVTQLPEATGAVPALEVRVGDVLWTRVSDFSSSGPEDCHYMVRRGETPATSVLFGDGRKGAVPPAGRRHIIADYRVGLGRVGNVEAGRLNRLQKAHPLVESLRNPLPISGGTEPAEVDQVRREATRFIRTFDRAVSAVDYADLALLFPGVARSKASSDPGKGVELVAADADGNAPSDFATFRAFLDARRDRSLELTLRAPEPVDVVLRVNVEHDPAFFRWQVEQAVRDVLTNPDPAAPGLFTFPGRELGETAFLSQAYQTVQRAAGVVFSQIVQFDLVENTGLDTKEPIAQDALRVAPHQWLRLLPTNLIVIAAIRSDD